MKTKILFTMLLIAIFGFAAQASAQDVIKFTNVRYSNGQVNAQIYCSQPVTVEFGVSSIFSQGSFNFTYKLGPQMVYRSFYGSETVRVTLPAGYNDIYGYITGSVIPYSYPQAYIYISRIIEGNAVLGSASETFLNYSKSS
jgi:hypothetical protein